VSHGKLDLREWGFITNSPLILDGEWEFYPGEFIIKENVHPSQIDSQEYVQVPGNWNVSTGKKNNYGYGSYRLRIYIDPSIGSTYGIRVPYISSSSEVYVNGELLSSSGKPAATKNQYKPSNSPYTVYFPIENESEIELVIQVANFDNLGKGGIARSIKFGLEEPLRKSINFTKNITLISCMLYLIHALYSLILFFIGNRDKRFLYFSVTVICIILGTLVGERLLFEWFPLNFEWGIKIKYLTVIFGGYFLLQCIRQQLSEFLHRKFVPIYNLISGMLVFLILILSAEYNLKFTLFYTMVMLIPCFLALLLMYNVTKHIDKNNIYLLLALIAGVGSLIWLIILTRLQIEMEPYPFDLMIAMICFAIYWFKRYFYILEESRVLMGELQKANEQKDEFLLTVAHEMKNPLHGILNISHAITEREKDNLQTKSLRDLKLLNAVGRRMSLMLNDLLELERYKENLIVIKPMDISIYSVTEAVMNILRFMTDGKNVKLENKIPKNFPNVRADENRLNQILFNLLHNAIKHTNEGEISVYATIKEEWAEIYVCDTGRGIDEEIQEKLFEPYVQSTSGHEGGFGLGLSICKKLVELHGGKMSVSSIPEKGSIFSFSLKLSSSTQNLNSVMKEPFQFQEEHLTLNEMAASMAERRQSKSVEPIRILAVDDDPINLKVLENIFELEIYHIYTTQNAQHALSMLSAHEWDLMIVDVMMPHMSGYELTTNVRKQYSILELPILLLTAHHRPEDIEIGFQVGANDYVTKPVNSLELKARVQSLTKVKKSISERLRMEAAWLQAQIKPHFIINTFNSIASLSRLNLDKMDELIHELSNYIRLSIDFQNIDGLSPLEEELQLVQSYLFIQKQRFGERLHVIWNTDEQIQFLIPPLTIQPLVENAIHHGLMKRIEGGEVRISIKDVGEKVLISVADNGVGMRKEKVAQLLNGDPANSGIGIINTDRRLRQLYGQGLRIKSKVGEGTEISFLVNK